MSNENIDLTDEEIIKELGGRDKIMKDDAELLEKFQKVISAALNDNVSSSNIGTALQTVLCIFAIKCSITLEQLQDFMPLAYMRGASIVLSQHLKKDAPSDAKLAEVR